MEPEHYRRVAVVVLGDLGRSPRMQYHALALADNRLDVDIVAYSGSAPLAALRTHPRIRLHLLPAPPPGVDPARLPGLTLTALRLCRQMLRLLWLLGRRLPKPDVILVQNPPAVPTLLVALIAARLRSATMIIDWHNFGCSMLGLKLPPNHPLLRLARWYERTLGCRADRHLCVSQAMRAELAAHWRVRNATVLYDRPAAQFAPAPAQLKHDFLCRIGGELDLPRDSNEHPALVVYPTGWSADEDFSLLLEAAVQCDRLISGHDRSNPNRPFPHLMIVITGQGALRRHYEHEIARLRLHKVHLRTLWLSPEDYPLMLGTADLGLCCHRSSSGFDLPMKIADLHGAGLPVLALNYGPCLAEQVREGQNGMLFADAGQLANQLYELFLGFPAAPRLERLRDNVQRSRPMRWDEGWKIEAAPVFAAA